jgi:hypothetical protein
MTQPQQHYDVTDDDFDFIWKNIDSPLVVRDRINVIKTRSHPYQSERDDEDCIYEGLADDSLPTVKVALSCYLGKRIRVSIEDLRAGEP